MGRSLTSPKGKEGFNPNDKGLNLYDQTVKNLKLNQEDPAQPHSKTTQGFYSSAKVGQENNQGIFQSL